MFYLHNQILFNRINAKNKTWCYQSINLINLQFFIGEMAEWSNAAVSKTVVRFTVNRGFESPSLRKAKANHPLPADGFYFTLNQSPVYKGDDSG